MTEIMAEGPIHSLFLFKYMKTVFFCFVSILILEFTLHFSTRNGRCFTATVKMKTSQEHTGTQPKYSPNSFSAFIDVQSFVETQHKHCNNSFKRTHLITPGPVRPDDRTGTLLFLLFSVLALAQDFCYTPVLKPSDYLLKLDNIFDITGIERSPLNDTNFLHVEEVNRTSRIFNRTFFNELDTSRNWTLNGYRQCYKLFNHHKQFLKSSVRFKPEFMDKARRYIKWVNNVRTPVCCVHVRRTDKLSLKPDLSWYSSYLRGAMSYVEKKVPGVKFIFVSDDIKWCRDNFEAANVYFSPFTNPGEDLALLSLSNHSILTIDTFGWMGAWLGDKSTDALIIHRGNNPDFYPQHWIRIR